jgi:hypothetical protein
MSRAIADRPYHAAITGAHAEILMRGKEKDARLGGALAYCLLHQRLPWIA